MRGLLVLGDSQMPAGEQGLVRTPYISVLVIAFTRTQFLKYALDSIGRQTLRRELFEVIVVSNSDMDKSSLEKLNARMIRTDLRELESKMALGMDACRGEVICIMEDDDEWEDNRLQAVYDLFTSRKDIGYYHNAFSLIGEDGKKLKDPMFRLMDRRMMRAGQYTRDRTDATFGSIRKMIKMGLSFNTSSMSFRSSILSERKELLVSLKGRSSNVDNFIFYACLLSGAKVYGDSRRLTRYRIHPQNTSKRFLTSGTRPEDLGFGILMKMTEGGAENIQIRRSVECMISDLRFEIYSKENVRDRRLMLSAIAGHMHYFSLSDMQYDFMLVLFGLLYFISPRLGSMMHSIPSEHLS